MEKKMIQTHKFHNIVSKGRSCMAKHNKVMILILVILMLVLPYVINSQYVVRIIIMVGVYTILALSLGLVTGYAGQVSLGHAAFYAIGAYTSAILSVNFNISFFITVPVAALVAALCGLVLGLPTLRLSGPYLAITTLGFGEVVRMILSNWNSVTNGPLGISRIPRPLFFGIELTLANNGLYYLVLAFVAITALVMLAIVKSKMGRAMMALREDEIAAKMMGIRITYYKVVAFVVSAFFSGLAGAFYAHMIRFIDPNSFTFDTSIMILSIVILGGMGTIKGMFLGAAVLVSFPEFARFLQEYRFVVYGLVLIMMMRYRPQGILGGQKKTEYKLPKGVIVNQGEDMSVDKVGEIINTVEEGV